MTNVELGKCRNCVFRGEADPEGGGYTYPSSRYGTCRRWAPTPLTRQLVAVTDDGYDTHKRAEWPSVRLWDWCGEFTAIATDADETDQAVML